MGVIKVIIALIFVISVALLFLIALKKVNSKYILSKRNQRIGRLAILDEMIIDHKRRLVLIRRDELCHLVLLSNDREMIIESNIKILDQSL